MNKIKTIAKISAITMLSGVAALNAGGFASASTAVPTGTTVKICRSIGNAFENTSATFNYTFTAGTGLKSNTMPSDQQISFTNASATSGTISKCIDVDVGGVTFTNTTPMQADVTVTETVTSGSISRDQSQFIITFDLRNTTNTSGTITGQEASLLYIKKSGDTQGTKLEKMDFTSDITPGLHELDITNEVGGTVGDKNKEFTFTLTIEKDSSGTYSTSGGSITPAGACSQGYNCFTIKLKHGETARIGFYHSQVQSGNQIPVGTRYMISQYSETGYETQHRIQSGSWINSEGTGWQTVVAARGSVNTVTFKNIKNADVPTGIFLNVWPYALLGAASVAIIYYTKKNVAIKKR